MAAAVYPQANLVRDTKDSPAILAKTHLDIEKIVQCFLGTAYSSLAESFPLELQLTGPGYSPDDRELQSINRVAQTSTDTGAKNLFSSDPREREDEVPGDSRKQDDDDDNNRDNDDRGGCKRLCQSTGGNASPQFSCPIQTRLAIRRPAESTQGHCGGFVSIQRLKDHLCRKHTAHPCRSCSTAFMTRAELDQHSASGSHGQHDSEEAAWRSIYQTLFPGESIPSPYLHEIEESEPDLAPPLGLLESVIAPILNPDVPSSPEPAILPTQLALGSTASPTNLSTLAVCSVSGCNHCVGPGSDSHIHGSGRPTSQHASVSRSVYYHRCLPCSIVDARTELAEILESSLSSSPSLSSILSHPAVLRTHVGSSPSGERPGGSEESGKSIGSSAGSDGNFRGQGNSGDRGLGDDSGGNGPPDTGGLQPREENLRIFSGYICCYHQNNPDEFGRNNRRSRWHKCETKEMSPFSELLKHYWNSHRKFICGECFANFSTSEERANHTKANSHCYYCFTAFLKASDIEGQLHHSDEFLSHQAQGCSRQYPQGKRDEYRWHKCCEPILGHAGRDHNPYFRSRAQQPPPPESREDEELSVETTQIPPGLQDNELRRLQAENLSQNETIVLLRREVEELRSSLSLANQRQSNLILAMSDICQVLRSSRSSSDNLPVGPNLHDQMDLWQNLRMGQAVTGLPAQTLNAINAGNGQSPQWFTNRIVNAAMSGQEDFERPNATTQHPQLAMFSPVISFPSSHLTFADSSPSFNIFPASVVENGQSDESFLQYDINMSDLDPNFIDFNAVEPSQLSQVQV